MSVRPLEIARYQLALRLGHGAVATLGLFAELEGPESDLRLYDGALCRSLREEATPSVSGARAVSAAG
jgi:hypothetical protein